MTNVSLDRQLCAATPIEVAEILGEALKTTDAASLIAHLLAATEAGALPPSVFQQYISRSRDPYALAAGLRQSYSASIRRAAISQLQVVLQAGPQFRLAWETLGGASGIAALLCKISVHDVDALCVAIAGPNGKKGDTAANIEKSRAITELYSLVCKSSPEGELPATRDPRPLEESYRRLFRACTAEFRARWRLNEIPDANAASQSRPQEAQRPKYPDYLLPGQEQQLSGQDKRSTKLEGVEWLLSQQGLRKVQKEMAEKIRVCHTKDLKIDTSKFYRHLLLPLVARMAKQRNLVTGSRDQTWAMVLACFRRWPELVHELNFEKGELLVQAIRWWNWVPTAERHVQAGTVLRALLDLVPASTLPPIVDYPDILRVKLQHRWELFVWLLRNPHKYGINVDRPSDEDKKKLKLLPTTVSIPSQLFVLLPANEAVDFLNLLSETRPDNTYLSARDSVWDPSYRWASILSHRAGPEFPSPGDFPLVHCLAVSRLMPQDPRRMDSKILKNVEEAIQSRMIKANQSRESSDRVFWANSALFLSIASGSLDLYSKTLRWARRFDKDFNTRNHLYKDDVLGTREGLNLLTAIPSSNRLSTSTVTTVSKDIVLANGIVLQLLDTAAAALAEPDFADYHWSYSKELLGRIVTSRIQVVNAFQQYHNLTDDEIYDLVWRPTISMIIDAEKFGLAEEHSRLNFGTRNGILQETAVEEPRGHIWKFIDDLARARDDVWHQERVKRCPDVLTLGVPWPKGLPVQDLIQFSFGQAALRLPYVVSRAEAVVFADAKQLLQPVPTDKETRNAISGFVDNYRDSLALYVNAGDGDAERAERVARAWYHAMAKLTWEVIANEEQARDFWGRWAFDSFSKWLPEPSLTATSSRPGPVFLRQEDPSELVEWHPDANARAGPSSEQNLPGSVSCLEFMLQNTNRYEPWTIPSEPARRTVPVRAVPGFWTPARYDTPLSGGTKDVYVAAAILYINSRIGSDSTLFKKPYPSSENPRFPAVYLADDFLEHCKPESLSHCFSILGTYEERVPPEMLLCLARSLLQRMKTTETIHAHHRKLTMDTIVLLSRGECPSMACGVIRDILIDGQGDSSWHRHLFNSGFLSLLPAEKVKRFLNNLADAMSNKLAQGRERKAPAPLEELPALTPSQPFIKVSTVKMLAQTLRGSNVVDEQTTCAILAKILSNSNHMDIKIAGIESLVEVFINTKDNELRQTIMDVLHKRVVPIAGSLVERRPMTEADWAKAEAEGIVPEVASASVSNWPLLNLLFSVGLDGPRKLTPEWHKKWVDTILFNILEKSAESNRRWMALFEKANSVTRPAGTALPQVPVVARLYNDLLRDRPEFVRGELFKRIKDLVMANISPSSEVAAINAKVGFVGPTSNGGQHWRALFGNRSTSALYLGVDTCAFLLRYPASVWATFPEDGLTVPLLQEFLFSVANVFIRTSDFRALNHLETALSTVPTWGFNRKECRQSQINNAIPVLECMVSLVNSLRTPSWQNNRHRHPRHLPDTFGTRLNMLPFPFTSFNPNSEPAPDAEITAFGTQVISLIEELIHRGTPYHDDWNLLKTAVSRSPVSKSDFLRIALVLSQGVADPDHPRKLTLADYMRAELARELIRKGGDPRDKAVLRRTRDLLVLQWKHHPDEVIRERARATIKGLQEAAKTRRDGNQFWAKYAEEWNSAVAAACAAFGAKSGKGRAEGWMGEDSSEDELEPEVEGGVARVGTWGNGEGEEDEDEDDGCFEDEDLDMLLSQ